MHDIVLGMYIRVPRQAVDDSGDAKTSLAEKMAARGKSKMDQEYRNNSEVVLTEERIIRSVSSPQDKSRSPSKHSKSRRSRSRSRSGKRSRRSRSRSGGKSSKRSKRSRSRSRSRRRYVYLFVSVPIFFIMFNIIFYNKIRTLLSTFKYSLIIVHHYWYFTSFNLNIKFGVLSLS